MLCKFWAATSHFLSSCGMKFSWNQREVVADQAAPIASLNLSIIHSSLSKNMTQEQNSMFRIEPCAKQQVCIDDLSEDRAFAQIRIEQRSDFRWRRARAWKRCQA